MTTNTARVRARRSISLGQRDPRDRRGLEIKLAPPLGVDSDGDLTIVDPIEKPGDVLVCKFGGWEAFDGLAIKVTPGLVTAAYTARMGEVVRCNPTAAGFTVTLPPAAGQAGKAVIVKNASASANVITVDGAGAELIDGAATTTIAAGWGALTLLSDGTGWMIV